MPEAFRADYPSNPYRVDPIYVRMTDPRNTNDNRAAIPSVRDLFGQLSVTSQFKVSLFFGSTPTQDDNVNNWLINCGIFDDPLASMKYEFMCHSATLPGSTFSTIDEVGSRQGITEKFPILRQFPEFTLDFYVDSNYGIIRLFEEWMNYINPLYSGFTSNQPSRSGSTSTRDSLDTNDYYRVKYPSQYKRAISITKFERNILTSDSLKDSAFEETPSMLTYRFLNAFPTNLTALPVSYEGSTITKTSVSFSYDRYVVQRHQGTRDLSQPNNVTQDGQRISRSQFQGSGSPLGQNKVNIAFNPKTTLLNPDS